MTNPVSRCATGIHGLDDILGGGFPCNRFFLIDGEPGAGKTTLALQFLLAGIRAGEPGLYITLSETRDELNSVAESHGWSLGALGIFELSAISDQLAIESQNTMFHPAEVELNRTTKLILDEVVRIKPMRVVFDSLSEMRVLAQNSLRYRRQMLALKQFFSQHGCTVLLIDDRTAEISDVNTIANGVLTMDVVQSDYGLERRRLNVIKLRGTKYRSGYHDYVIKTGGIEVFPRLVASEHHRPFARERIGSGIPDLDALLGGGLDRGTSSLFMGPAGSGKSSLATRYAVEMAKRGERVGYFAFDETVDSLMERSTNLGMPLSEHLESGALAITQIDPAELSPGEFAHRIRRLIDHDRRTMIIIDSLNGYLHSMPNERYLVLQLHELLTYLNQNGITTVMVSAQAGLVGTMQSPVDLTYLADTVLLFRFFEATGAIKRAISVIKKRRSGHEKTIREFTIDHDGIHVGKPLTQFQGVLSGIPTLRVESQKALESS
jgi:circadian clock protein KaiC